MRSRKNMKSAHIVVIQPDVAMFPPTPAQYDRGIKAHEAEAFAQHRALAHSRIAGAIEAAPKRAKRYASAILKRRLARQTLSHPFAVQWARILEEKSTLEICALMRDTTEKTEQLRLSNPFAGFAKR
jgi:hypothetical protein